MIEIESAMHDYFYTLPGTFIHNYEFCTLMKYVDRKDVSNFE